MTVAEATSSAALVFQAVHLAQQAAPAIRMATGRSRSSFHIGFHIGFHMFSSGYSSFLAAEAFNLT